MAVQLDQYAPSYTWLSTDTRPPSGPPGAMARELDTGQMFRSDGNRWMAVSALVGADTETHILLQELVHVGQSLVSQLRSLGLHPELDDVS